MMTMTTNHPPSAPSNSTTASSTFPSQHSDYISAIAFDHYGRRIATCAGDRTVHIWDLDSEGEDWVLTNTISNAHWSGIVGISWAHPEFGQVLATCGNDGVAIVWEERSEEVILSTMSTNNNSNNNSNTPTHHTMMMVDSSNPNSNSNTTSNLLSNANNNMMGNTRWMEKVRLMDARRALSCIKFAPRHLGLELATGSADGHVRIYEAVDAMNLNHWFLKNSIELMDESALHQDHVHPTHTSTHFPSHPSSSKHSSASVTSNTTSSSSAASASAAAAAAASMTSPSGSDLGVRCLDWCTGRFEAPTLVIGGSLGTVAIYRYSDVSRSWQLYLQLDSHVTSSGLRHGVLDVAWAPNVGRSYHWIASCGRDGIFRVTQLKRVRNVVADANAHDSNHTCTISGYEIESSQILDTDDCEVWKCAWNITGTVLAGSGDGGMVSLYKADYKNQWKCVSEIRGGVGASTSSSANGMGQKAQDLYPPQQSYLKHGLNPMRNTISPTMASNRMQE